MLGRNNNLVQLNSFYRIRQFKQKLFVSFYSCNLESSIFGSLRGVLYKSVCVYTTERRVRRTSSCRAQGFQTDNFFWCFLSSNTIVLFGHSIKIVFSFLCKQKVTLIFVMTACSCRSALPCWTTEKILTRSWRIFCSLFFVWPKRLWR